MKYWNSCEEDEEVKSKRPGPLRLLSAKEELLMVLMKLKLNSTEQYFGVLFGISPSSVSRILSTWIPFLAKELDSNLFTGLRQKKFSYHTRTALGSGKMRWQF